MILFQQHSQSNSRKYTLADESPLINLARKLIFFNGTDFPSIKINFCWLASLLMQNDDFVEVSPQSGFRLIYFLPANLELGFAWPCMVDTV